MRDRLKHPDSLAQSEVRLIEVKACWPLDTQAFDMLHSAGMG
jgi:hypothetical protein